MVDAGIRPVMITGDHPATARAIARQVGLPTDHVTTGAELDAMTEEERVQRAADTTIFARVSPEQKVRIGEALRAAGRVVAMTGDGTNDAAAIRLTEVGIDVGAASSSAARSYADLVLAEPDLLRIHDALVEGRQMWHRMREAVSILVGGNAGEMGFMMLGTAVVGRAPINIREMLVDNLLTDMFPALALALASSHSPEEAAAPVGSTLGKSLARAVAFRGTTTALGATLGWTIGRYTGRGRRADTHETGRARGHPARSDTADRLTQPARRSHDAGLHLGADPRGGDPWRQPVVRLHADRTVRLGRRRGVTCGRDGRRRAGSRPSKPRSRGPRPAPGPGAVMRIACRGDTCAAPDTRTQANRPRVGNLHAPEAVRMLSGPSVARRSSARQNERADNVRLGRPGLHGRDRG
jgi:hypothetical protein